jgi:hypothetical protein
MDAVPWKVWAKRVCQHPILWHCWILADVYVTNRWIVQEGEDLGALPKGRKAPKATKAQKFSAGKAVLVILLLLALVGGLLVLVLVRPLSPPANASLPTVAAPNIEL